MAIARLDFHRQCSIKLLDFDGTSESKVRTTHFRSEWVLRENVYGIVAPRSCSADGGRGKTLCTYNNRTECVTPPDPLHIIARSWRSYTHYKSSVEIRPYLRFLFFSPETRAHTRARAPTKYTIPPLRAERCKNGHDVSAVFFDFDPRRTRLRVHQHAYSDASQAGVFSGGNPSYFNEKRHCGRDECCADSSKRYRSENNLLASQNVSFRAHFQI